MWCPGTGLCDLQHCPWGWPQELLLITLYWPLLVTHWKSKSPVESGPGVELRWKAVAEVDVAFICSIFAWNESYDLRNCLIEHNFICYLHLKKGSTLHWWQIEDKYAEGLQQQQNYCSKIGIVWKYKVVCYHLIWEIMQNINVGTGYDSNNGCVIRCHYIIITLIKLINHYYLLLLLINHYYLLLLE